MRRRFGRGRRGRGASAEGRAAPIDAARAAERMVEHGAAGARELTPLADPGIPDHFAALAEGETQDGTPLLVAFSPVNGGDAALAALACAARRVEQDAFGGEVAAVAPQWSIAARRRRALIGATPFRFSALAVSALDEGGARIEPEIDAPVVAVPLRHAAAALEDGAVRETFVRALASLEGLAAKHGGAVRGGPRGAELVLLGRCVAVLHADRDVTLETLHPERSSIGLAADGLANALDRLEGLLRKRLNDRRIRGGEEGLRASLLAPLAAALELRASRPWPLPGSDPEVLDLAGVGADGRAVVAVAREQLTLPQLAAVLDAFASAQPVLPALLADGALPLSGPAPRLVLAASEYEEAALRALSQLAIETALFDVSQRRGSPPQLVAREGGFSAGAAAATPAESPAPAPRERRPRQRRPRPEAGPAPEAVEPAGEEAEDAGAESGEAAREAPSRRFEEISLFDLEDEARGDGADEESGGRRRRRGRRRRGRRGQGAPAGGDGDDSAGAEAQSESPPASRGRGERRPRGRGRDAAEEPPAPEPEEEAPEEDVLEDLDLDLGETLAPLAADVPDLEEPVAEPGYDDEDEEAEEPDPLQEEREARRRARIAKTSPAPAEPEPAPRPPRRRAAFVAHADRDSVIAAILLARDLRLVEGFWVYPQEELMTFFRSVCTDLRDDTPIHVVGFTASPARDSIQAASLYEGRIDWYDHHDWPPEDLESLRGAIGRDRVVVQSGVASSLPAVLSMRTRRSRFSDKLVELATGAFTLHDFERWGRLWWQRLGDIASRAGDRRSDIDALLAGRPSDLAREASGLPVPPPPPEVAYVSERDFRLVHFGGYTLAVVPVPGELDLHLTARAARERYNANLSVAYRGDQESVVLGGDEGRGRRGLDLGRMSDHLASKHEWIESLPGHDHVARIRVRDLATKPERIDEVIREIAMGRSILEG